MRDGQDAREQAVVAVVAAAPGSGEGEPVLALGVEPDEEQQRIGPRSEGERIRDQIADLPGVGGKASTGRIVLGVDARAGPGRVVKVHEDVPALELGAAPPVQSQLRPLAGDHLRRLQLVPEQLRCVAEDRADDGRVGRGRHQDVSQRAAVHLRPRLCGWRLLERALDASGADQGESERAHRSRIVPEAMLFRHTVEPLGSFERIVEPGAGLALGALAITVATALLELSRTLAETYRGRWFAGNGRDVFHAGAALAMAVALFANGLPPALAALASATVLMLPLLILDSLPARRPPRAAMLFALVGIGAAPPLLEPLSIVQAANALARFLFY